MTVNFECMIVGFADGKTRYEKTCDVCGKKSHVTRYDILKCHRRRNTINDYCQPCSIQVYNTGDGNPSKRKDVREKISKATRGISKNFKDGKNPRFVKVKKTVNGYLLEWDDISQRHAPQHRLVMERFLGRKLSKAEQVHHIDGDKRNNDLYNLYLTDNASKHSKIHSQLERVAFQAVGEGLIYFDNSIGEYKLTNNG